ncbi:MAG: hypothetical protein DYG93_07030 [Leptolyngbya sp. PLA2]|nr:hypothetical protein [Leptolyngbya sp.]MCE7971403.1 hypothetical protein [Leptolyngbya sp. PL-A2]MCQ3940618.1 hypothetical protein [cyanobacterium CYA1]MCZ7632384.1 hypothetical protein [Phycisphaerales bacterium]MDL1903589.1 hypothetical protein [Synechococcales cyanobacterium CNB]GIK20060.1 MAG: hypothetical protein BroJett004_22240 [Planctomycetota bacterium]
MASSFRAKPPERGVGLLSRRRPFPFQREGTQNEIVHNFDAIDTAGASLAQTSDDHPQHLDRLSAQLRRDSVSWWSFAWM